MMDPSHKDQESLLGCEEGAIDQKKRFCFDCKTTKTPLWRSGPTGPKSLCNACGIRYRKRKSVTMGLNKSSEKKKEKLITTAAATSSCSSSSSQNNSKMEGSIGSGKDDGRSSGEAIMMRERVMALGKEVVLLQRQRSPVKRQRSHNQKLGEVEEAAFLLMALSCGAVFA